jgi:hypothetical protein
MKFEVEEIENDVDIPLPAACVRFAVKDSTVTRAQFITEDEGVISTIEEIVLQKVDKPLPLANNPLLNLRPLPFFGDSFIDGAQATNARIRVFYTGERYPELVFEVGDKVTHNSTIKYENKRIIFNWKLSPE